MAAAAARTARRLRAEAAVIRIELERVRHRREALTAEAAQLRAALAEADGRRSGEPDAPPSREALLRALDLPDGNDPDGDAALRAALRHPGTAALVVAARDVMAALARDGIHVDDLPPSGRAAPGDGATLDASRARMRDDAAFADAADDLVAGFDAASADFAALASDAQVAALARTRIARLAALCARLGAVAGVRQAASSSQRPSP